MSGETAHANKGGRRDLKDEDEMRAMREYETDSNPYWHPERVDIFGDGDFHVVHRTESELVLESVYHPYSRLVHDLVEGGCILIDEISGTESKFRGLDDMKEAFIRGEITLE